MSHINSWLALSRLPSVGLSTARRLLDYFKTPDALFSARIEDWQDAGLNEKQIHALNNVDWKTAEKNLRWVEENNCTLVTIHDPRYPTRLREIYDAPLVLYVQGDVSLLNDQQIAIVGSRNPTVVGREIAEHFAKELARAGWVITSGLALGVDAASHRGTLAVAGKTIAVVGTGLDHIYPRTHQKLAEDIITHGAIVSEFHPDTLPKSIHFPMRNRIISGLCYGVLVVEAAIRSGSLITARLALEQNREVFAIPGSIHNPLSRGCHQLIRQGAKLVETASDILEEVGVLNKTVPFHAIVPENKEEAVDLDPKHQRVLAQIGYEVTAVDDIILRAGLTTGELSSMLLSLELEGYVRSVPGGYARTSI